MKLNEVEKTKIVLWLLSLISIILYFIKIPLAVKYVGYTSILIYLTIINMSITTQDKIEPTRLIFAIRSTIPGCVFIATCYTLYFTEFKTLIFASVYLCILPLYLMLLLCTKYFTIRKNN